MEITTGASFNCMFEMQDNEVYCNSWQTVDDMQTAFIAMCHCKIRTDRQTSGKWFPQAKTPKPAVNGGKKL